MAIAVKEMKDVTTTIRSIYQKGSDLISKNQLDYGIELLKQVVQKEPGFLDARKLLRSAERAKSSNLSVFEKFMTSLKCIGPMIKAQSLVSKDPVASMAQTEEVLSMNLFNASALRTLATAAKNAGANFACSEALDLMIDMDPGNEGNLKAAASLYEAINDGRNLLKVWQHLANKYPENLEYQGRLREAAAMATMEEGAWDKKESAAAKAAAAAKKKKTENAAAGDRIIRSKEDVENMIGQFESQIAGGNESVDLRKKLAELYYRAGRFEESIAAYRWIVEKLGTLDPAIDRLIEKSQVAIYNEQLKQLRENGGSEDEINTVEKAKYDYRLERYEDRVRLYPNDLMCRYDLAEIFWEGGEVDKSLEQFQLAQRNPSTRLQAMTYLGRCFHAKKQYDMAVEEFNKVLSDMPTMSKEKMNTLYYLGLTYEDIGDREQAVKCFKQIYSANVNYMDVADRMNAYYAEQAAARNA